MLTEAEREQLREETREARKRVTRLAACLMEPCTAEQLRRFAADLNNMAQVLQTNADYLQEGETA